MNNAVGIIIKLNRIKQKISQAELSKEICVPSYLSKIENGEITAHEDIYQKLLLRLGLDYDNFISGSSNDNKIEEIIHCILSLKSKQAKTLYNVLDTSYEHSQYVFEYLALKYYYSQQKDSDIQSLLMEYAPDLDEITAFFVLMMLYMKNKNQVHLLNAAIKTHTCGYGYFIKGLSLYQSKSFNDAYKYYVLAENEYLKSGDLLGIVHCKKHQAIVLSYKEDKTQALQCYKSLINLVKDVSSTEIDGLYEHSVYNYNMLKFTLGLDNDLKKICLDLVDSDLFKNSLPYHVLYKIYKDEDVKKAQAYIHEGNKKYASPQTFDYMLLDIDLFKINNPDYIKSEVYYHKLKTAYQLLIESRNYLLRYEIENDIIAYLKSNRKYKEALEMTEAISQLKF